MPYGDGTGPRGLGPTGWGRGPCGRGMRRGLGYMDRPVELSKEEQKKILQAEMKEIEKKLKELK